jgi:hypothetical protein
MQVIRKRDFCPTVRRGTAATLRSFTVHCSVRLLSSVAILWVAAASAGWSSGRHPRETQVTWASDVGPILHRRCVGCHVDGGFAPMSLTTYEQARQWSRAISEQVMERRMPPWPAVRGFGDFVNDRSLSPLEIELLVAWQREARPGATRRGRLRCSGRQHSPRRLTLRSVCRLQHRRRRPWHESSSRPEYPRITGLGV